MGGSALIAVDVPALFMVSFRGIQQIGASYGFDMQDPAMFPVIMRVFSAGSAVSTPAKTAALLDLHVAAAAFSKNWTYAKVADRTATGAAAIALKEATRHLPKEIANRITKRKLAQTIPVVGAAIGAGFNYWFVSTTLHSAYMSFRYMYLARKYPEWEKFAIQHDGEASGPLSAPPP
jgi:hypothetical protein